jgi:hypothetical protein
MFGLPLRVFGTVLFRHLDLARVDMRFRQEAQDGHRTVYRYKASPGRRSGRLTGRAASILEPYLRYLLKHWEEGRRDGKRLSREMCEQGYTQMPGFGLLYPWAASPELRKAPRKS